MSGGYLDGSPWWVKVLVVPVVLVGAAIDKIRFWKKK